MATKTVKSSSSSSSSSSGDDFLSITKAIASLKKGQEAFDSSVKTLTSTIENYFDDLELKIASKKREFESLDEEFKHTRNNLRIAVDMDIKEHGYNAALKLLAERGETPIPETVLNSMRSELKQMREDSQNSLRDALKQAQEKAEKSKAFALRAKELEFNAMQAETKASLSQKEKEVQVLINQINDLKGDLDKQRSLTQAVAESSRPQYHNPLPPQILNGGR